jgi:hypothetical protein
MISAVTKSSWSSCSAACHAVIFRSVNINVRIDFCVAYHADINLPINRYQRHNDSL